MNNTGITLINPLQLKPHPSNSKKHPKKQVEAIADSIQRYGFNIPIVVRNGYILAGHGRVEASKILRLNVVPCIVLDHLTDEEARAFIIADNRTSELGEWDKDKLYHELKELSECEIPSLDMDLMQLGALCGDLDFGELRAEFPADRDDRLGEYVEPDEDFGSDFKDEEDDEVVTSETTPQKKEPINFTFMVILNKQQHKRLSELKNGLSDKQFFLQNVLGESDEH
ncbi:MAG: ParB/Srx family N-terminal domain-containing protein [Moraxella sp.]|nr:ParB/Srx family N-terminal domain-containing protein [Moraxella sp.]